MIPCNWTGPIVVRSSDYLKSLQVLLSKNPTRVAHNSILLLFALGILPQGRPDPIVCTKATMWALPKVASALYMQQHSQEDIKEVLQRVRRSTHYNLFRYFLNFLIIKNISVSSF